MPIKVKVYYINKDTTEHNWGEIKWNIKIFYYFFLKQWTKNLILLITKGVNPAAFTYQEISYHLVNTCKREAELAPSNY